MAAASSSTDDRVPLVLENRIKGAIKTEQIKHEGTSAKTFERTVSLLSLVANDAADVPLVEWRRFSEASRSPAAKDLTGVFVDPETAALLANWPGFEIETEATIKPPTPAALRRMGKPDERPEDSRAARTITFVKTITLFVPASEVARIKLVSSRPSLAQLRDLSARKLEAQKPKLVVGSVALDPTGRSIVDHEAEMYAKLEAEVGDPELAALVKAHYRERCAARLNQDEFPVYESFGSLEDATARARELGLGSGAVIH
jgi:hypothetical protein